MRRSLFVVSMLALACGDDAGGQAGSSEGSSGAAGVTAAASSGAGSVATGGSGGSADGGSTAVADATGEDSTGGLPTVDCDDLEGSLTLAGMRAHLEALDAIGAANGGTRSIGTPGFDASAEYVRGELEAAGYAVQPLEFDINVFSILGPSSLAWVGQQAFVDGTDFQPASYSAAGSISARVSEVDLQLGVGNASTSGCEPGDFAGFVAGRVALIQRGTCFISQKVTNAQAAGASAVIVFNQGDTADRRGLWLATLGAQTPVSVPVLLTTYDVGAAMAQAAGNVDVELEANVSLQVSPTRNLVVETETGDPHDVIMLGAHLDSVPAGPGINDNGSGSAALLELARIVRQCGTTRKLRFAWWSAEEVGLVGSQIYVDGLDAMARSDIRVYLNFDMVASPNWVRYRYDGDGSAFGTVGPMGSAELEQVFTDYFISRGLDSEETAFDGRSDYGPFIAAGIAAGGLFTGAEDVKSDEQAAANGGAAGQPFDACYHAECDDIANINDEVFDVMGDAIAHVVQLYALG